MRKLSVSWKTMFLSIKLHILPSIVHNNAKRFRESGEISVATGRNRCWMRVTIRPQVVLFEKPSCYHGWHSHIGWGTLENYCHSTQSAAASINATSSCITQRGRHLLILILRPCCSPDLSSIDNVWRVKRRIRQGWPQTIEQLKSYIHQDWAKISLTKLQQLIYSVPKRLQSVIKRKLDITQW